jgi:hypothetical protein
MSTQGNSIWQILSSKVTEFNYLSFFADERVLSGLSGMSIIIAGITGNYYARCVCV